MLLKQANWIVSKEDWKDVCPTFCKQFQVDGAIKSAVLLITALGVYEAELNGSRVGEFVLAPGWTDYNYSLQVQEYDVTAMLKEENCLRITVGRGWFNGRIRREEVAYIQNFQNESNALLAALKIIYQDGREHFILTDEDWSSCPSAILCSDIYDGETYDSRQENAQPSHGVKVVGINKSILAPQRGEMIREMERIKPVSLLHTPQGDTLIDFGQNLAGYVEFKVKANAGDQILLQHAEILDKDGNFYTGNLRTAKQEINFICNGEEQVYHPHFSFQGFRYVKLVQWPGEISLDDFTAIVVYSNMKRTGDFSCSDERINKLFQNIVWGQKGNFVDVPTDCPQRDERLGWLGDAQVFVRTASYNFDVEKFFSKWLYDLKTCQYSNGSIPYIVPNVFYYHEASAAWGDAAVICPWQIYLTYGNKKILEQQFESMRRFIEYVKQIGSSPYLWDDGEHYGDWLALDAEEGSYRGATDDFLIATAFFAYSTSLFIKAGHVLKQNMAEYEILYENIRKAYQEKYIDGGKLTTQTSLVLTLYFKLYRNENERAKMSDQLAALIHEAGDHLTTGFVGTPYLLHALSENGYSDLAYKLLLRDEYPSWLYSVKMGATTVWEHWDGMKPDGTMWSDRMNSFNHYAYGAVADWMYGVMAGIQTDETAPGFQHVIFRPVTNSEISKVSASIETRQGRVSSSWHKEGNKTVYEFVVPCSATAHIDDQTYELGKGQHVITV